MSRDVVDAVARYRRAVEGRHPPAHAPAYRATALRHPTQPLIALPQTISELTGPVRPHDAIGPLDHDLTRQHTGPPIGERIVVEGRVLDDRGRPVRGTLVEIWQANAAGRYAHAADTHDAPLDPNFSGAGRTETDEEGRYRFVTIKPAHYPWGNHHNAWRPAHIHFSLFGPSVVARLVTQMYFPGDPLHDLDPIFNAVADPAQRARLVARFDPDRTQPGWALAFNWDIVLRGRDATPMDA